MALTVPDHLPKAISDVDNVALMETPSEEDVKWAVFFINKDKSPRPLMGLMPDFSEVFGWKLKKM